MAKAGKATVRRGRENRPNEIQKALESLGATGEGALKELLGAQKEADADAHLTEKEIADRLEKRFDIIAKMAKATMVSTVRAMVVSGPPGLGKTFTIDGVLQELDPNRINHSRSSGYAKATGLYKLLYAKRNSGQVIVFDDCDSIFWDPVSLNMLKAACDTTRERWISYLSEYKLTDDETGEPIPNEFQFEGSIIFITNINFDKIIDSERDIATHLAALISRAHYIDCAMHSKRSYLIRINQVVKTGLLKSRELTKEQQKEIIDFVTVYGNKGNLRELSLRIVVKIADLVISNPKDWKEIAKVTCCRGLV